MNHFDHNRGASLKAAAKAALEKKHQSISFNQNAFETLNIAYEHIQNNFQEDHISCTNSKSRDRRKISKDEAACKSLCVWKEAGSSSPEDQRAVLEVKESKRIISLREFAEEVDIISLVDPLSDPQHSSKIKSRIARLFSLPLPSQATVQSILEAGSPGGSLRYIGSGSEAIVFYDMQYDKVIKLGRVEKHRFESNTPSLKAFKMQFTLGVRQEFVGAPDFAAIQSLNDYNRAFGDSIEFLGILGEMEFLLYRQDAQEPVLNRRGEVALATSEEIHDFMVSSGWQRVLTPGFDFWFHSELRMIAADTHSGNLVKTTAGLVPIDIITRQLDLPEAKGISHRFGLDFTD